MILTYETGFEAGHYLKDYPGHCSNFHGHSYKISVNVEGKINRNGMVVDFHKIKEQVDEIVKLFDHRFLIECGSKRSSKGNFNCDIPGAFYLDFPPTAENIAKVILSMLRALPNKGDFHYAGLSLWETENCFVSISTFDLENDND